MCSSSFGAFLVQILLILILFFAATSPFSAFSVCLCLLHFLFLLFKTVLATLLHITHSFLWFLFLESRLGSFTLLIPSHFWVCLSVYSNASTKNVTNCLGFSSLFFYCVNWWVEAWYPEHVSVSFSAYLFAVSVLICHLMFLQSVFWVSTWLLNWIYACFFILFFFLIFVYPLLLLKGGGKRLCGVNERRVKMKKGLVIWCLCESELRFQWWFGTFCVILILLSFSCFVFLVRLDGWKSGWSFRIYAFQIGMEQRIRIRIVFDIVLSFYLGLWCISCSVC